MRNPIRERRERRAQLDRAVDQALRAMGYRCLTCGAEPGAFCKDMTAEMLVCEGRDRRTDEREEAPAGVCRSISNSTGSAAVKSSHGMSRFALYARCESRSYVIAGVPSLHLSIKVG